MDEKFIGNISTRKLHILQYADGRCKINAMRKENKKEFNSLEEAMSYPDKENPIFTKCGICFTNMKKQENNTN